MSNDASISLTVNNERDYEVCHILHALQIDANERMLERNERFE